jgi:uncharacterized protein
VEIGVRLLVCQPSLDLHGYTMDDMIEGVEMIGGAAFNDMAVQRRCGDFVFRDASVVE